MSEKNSFLYSKKFYLIIGSIFSVIFIGAIIMGFSSQYYEKNHQPLSYTLIINPHGHNSIITLNEEISRCETIDCSIYIEGDNPTEFSLYLISEKIMSVYFNGNYDLKTFVSANGTQIVYESDNRQYVRNGIQVTEKSEYRFYFFNDANSTIEVSFTYKINHWFSDFSSAMLNTATISFGLLIPLVTIFLAGKELYLLWKSKPSGPIISFYSIRAKLSITGQKKCAYNVTFAISNSGGSDTIAYLNKYSFKTEHNNQDFTEERTLLVSEEYILDSGKNTKGDFILTISKKGKDWNKGKIILYFDYTSDKEEKSETTEELVIRQVK